LRQPCPSFECSHLHQSNLVAFFVLKVSFDFIPCHFLSFKSGKAIFVTRIF